MTIGGNGESWMAIGPVVAVILVVTVTLGGPDDVLQIAERFINDGWEAVVQTLLR